MSRATIPWPRRRPREEADLPPGAPGFLSSAETATLGVGPRVRPGELGGYHIDFTRKARSSTWPPHWLGPRESVLFVAPAQWGLGAYDRHLASEGDEWLAAAVAAAEYLIEHQQMHGVHEGGWVHRWSMHHTYPLERPWVSAMAQGEGASLLVRAHAATGEDRFAEAALRALRLLSEQTAKGGVRVALERGFLLEEYPTRPPSLVLNGAIFALWGYYDVAVGLGDRAVMDEFERGAAALAESLRRWDTGAWSRYDLFPHPVANLASSFYHDLHINQIRAQNRIASDPRLVEIADRFERYRASRRLRAAAFARKAVFRIAVPRNRHLAGRFPFGPQTAR